MKATINDKMKYFSMTQKERDEEYKRRSAIEGYQRMMKNIREKKQMGAP
jgi:hypothetical protein